MATTQYNSILLFFVGVSPLAGRCRRWVIFEPFPNCPILDFNSCICGFCHQSVESCSGQTRILVTREAENKYSKSTQRVSVFWSGVDICFRLELLASMAAAYRCHEEELPRRAWWDRSLLSGGLKQCPSWLASCTEDGCRRDFQATVWKQSTVCHVQRRLASVSPR